jgi:hypothetical protein
MVGEMDEGMGMREGGREVSKHHSKWSNKQDTEYEI